MRPAPPYTQNIPIGEAPLEGAAQSRPQTSTAAPVGGTGWNGRGQGAQGRQGPKEGVSVQRRLLLTRQSPRPRPSAGTKPEPATREWPRKAARGALAARVPGRNV